VLVLHSQPGVTIWLLTMSRVRPQASAIVTSRSRNDPTRAGLARAATGTLCVSFRRYFEGCFATDLTRSTKVDGDESALASQVVPTWASAAVSGSDLSSPLRAEPVSMSITLRRDSPEHSLEVVEFSSQHRLALTEHVRGHGAGGEHLWLRESSCGQAARP
jgi:hypothetical protein